jgi:hypothetical protein
MVPLQGAIMLRRCCAVLTSGMVVVVVLILLAPDHQQTQIYEYNIRFCLCMGMLLFCANVMVQGPSILWRLKNF